MSEHIISVLLRATGAAQFGSQMGNIVRSANLAQQAVSGVGSAMTGLKLAVAGAVGGFTIGSVMKLGQEFENTQNKMAGFLTTLGEAPNFTAGLQQAAEVYKKIEITSSALPGSAEDYVRVFTTALPQVQRSVGGTLDEMTRFTNQITAVGATFGMDAMQIGNDLRRILQAGKGGAGMDVQLFTQLLPFLTRLEGQANLTNESFNKMSEKARAALLQQVIYGNGIKQMIDNAANGWEAMSGTLTTIAKTVWRLGTSPLFEGMKEGARGVAAMFMDANGELTEMGNTLVTVSRVISSGLVEGVRAAVDGVSWLSANYQQLYDQVSNAVLPIFQTKIDMIANALPSLGNTLDLLAGGLAKLWDVVQPLLPIFSFVTDAILGLVLNAIEPMARGVVGFIDTIGEFSDWFGSMIENILGWLVPPVMELGKGIGKLVEGVLHFAGPIIGMLVGGVLKVAEYAAPVIGFLIDRLAEFGKGLGEILYWLGDKMREWFGMDISGPSKAPATKGVSDMSKNLATMFANMKAAFAWGNVGGKAGIDMAGLARRKVPTARSGTQVHQDFRNSRFTVEQKFEEGFDPERVAIAFSRDIQRIGEFKLQSGLEPLFSPVMGG